MRSLVMLAALLLRPGLASAQGVQLVAKPAIDSTRPAIDSGQRLRVPIFDDDAGTVSHVTWTGAALAESKAYTWTTSGSPTQTSKGKKPAGATGFTDSVYYSSQATTDPLDFQTGNDFTVCVVFEVSAWTTSGHNATESTIVGNGAYASQGYFLDINSTTTLFYMSRAGAAASLDAQVAVPLNTISVACFGRATETAFVKVNGKTTRSGAWLSPYTKGTGMSFRIGRDSGSAGVWFIGTIYEVWGTSTTPSDALFTAIHQTAKARLGNPTW